MWQVYTRPTSASDFFFVNMGTFFARKIMLISPAISAVKIHSGRKIRPFEIGRKVRPFEKSGEKSGEI
jgi:hypothetical protein